MRGRSLVAGRGEGLLLRLTRPLSLWGGVDPVRGTIVDPRHPQVGASIAGTVLLIPEPIGSSSSSAIMLELIREGTAPAAVVLGRRDAILALGAVVALELGYGAVPVVEVASTELGAMPDGTRVRVVDGDIERVGER